MSKKPEVLDKALYEKAKKEVYAEYDKPSAYRSMALVKKYKALGGRYSGRKESGDLYRWKEEEWKDIGGKDYPVYRPTKRITEDTPLTPDEIKTSNLRSQILKKQIYKGKRNLPAFIEK